MRFLSSLLESDYVRDVLYNPEKCFLLGWLLSNLSDHPDTLKQAEDYYKIASNQGHVRAQYNFGLMQALELGRTYPFNDGFTLINTAAGHPYPKAWEALGWLYETGRLVPQPDFTRSREYYLFACQQGYFPAAHQLAQNFFTGEPDIGFNPTEVIAYLQKASARNHAPSICTLGKLYWLGVSLRQDKQEGLAYLTKAANLGDWKAMNMLLTIYREDEVYQDPTQAEIWSEKISQKAICSNPKLAMFRQLEAQVTIGNYEFLDSRLALSVLIRNSARTPEIEAFFGNILTPERLEHLGDRELNVVISRKLSYLLPNQDRDTIQKLYEKFTRNADEDHPEGGPMYRVAVAIGLEHLLVMGRDDPLPHMKRFGKSKKKRTIETQLSNHIEILIGAISQDGGYEVVESFINDHWDKLGLNASELAEDEFGASGSSAMRISANRHLTFPSPPRILPDYAQAPQQTILNFPIRHVPSRMIELPNGEVIFAGNDSLYVMNHELNICLKILDEEREIPEEALDDYYAYVDYTNLVAIKNTWVASCHSCDPIIRIWDAQAGENLRNLEAHRGQGVWGTGVWGALMLLDGRLASWGKDNTLKIWNVDTGQCLNRFLIQNIHLCQIRQLSNGNLAYGGPDNTLKILDVNTGVWVKIFVHNSKGSSKGIIKLLPISDHFIVSNHWLGKLHLWDLWSNQEVITNDRFQSLGGSLNKHAILPNGNLIIASQDNKLSIWKIPECECLNEMSGVARSIRKILAVSNDYVILHDDGGGCEVWDLNEKKLLQRLTISEEYRDREYGKMNFFKVPGSNITMAVEYRHRGSRSESLILSDGRIIITNNWGAQVLQFPEKVLEEQPRELEEQPREAEETCIIL